MDRNSENVAKLNRTNISLTTESTSTYELLHSVNERLEALDKRMDRIEGVLEKILDRLDVSTLKEEEGQEVHGALANEVNPEVHQEKSGREVAIKPDSNEPYSYTSLDSAKSEIRILAVYCPENATDPVTASLKILSLDDNSLHEQFHSYLALSYCWGPPIMDGMVFLDGSKFPVTKSLESALRNLRTLNSGITPVEINGKIFDRTTYFWIDQICINQSDIDERNSQVALMRRIYKHASAVHVWLGDEAEDSSIAIDLLSTLGRPPLHAPGEKAIHYPSFTEDEISRHWVSLKALFRRPWWERVWIRQEVALHYAVTLWCGKKNCEMDALGPALFVLKYIQDLESPRSISYKWKDDNSALLRWDHHPSKLVELRRSTNGGFTWVDLARLLVNARGCKATDLRDSVFSMLGLCDPELYPLLPDYRQNLNEILVDATQAAVNKEYGLDVLGACQNPERKQGLPSWVPNLGDDWKAMPFKAYNMEGSRISGLHITSVETPEAHIEHEALVLQGGIIDAVQFLCTEFVENQTGSEEYERVFHAWHKFVEDASRSKKIIEYEAWQYLESEDPERTQNWIKLLSVFSDEGRDLEKHSYAFSSKNRVKGNKRNIISALEPDWHSNPYHHVSLNFKLARSYLLLSSHSVSGQHPNYRIHAGLQAYGVGRRLCITKRGLLALVPDEVKAGDPIALFQGASFAYVVKKSEVKDYKLVGEAWIPSWAYGNGEILAEEEWRVGVHDSIRLC